MEYSDTFHPNQNNELTIGGRSHSAIEFALPPAKAVYDIVIGG